MLLFIKYIYMKNFVDELKWRGMIHDVTPSTSEYLEKNKTSAKLRAKL